MESNLFILILLSVSQFIPPWRRDPLLNAITFDRNPARNGNANCQVADSAGALRAEFAHLTRICAQCLNAGMK
jgi:hypothetical protein